ncbi:MAG: LytS/YhcK type 5TM receptor domain-containing protein [Pseudomonadota bacterium]
MIEEQLNVTRDFIGSLAVICLLAMAYGTIRRNLPGVALAPQLLGMLFGFVAVLQMYAPIEPFPGMIIDLRVVPVILAGAFLRPQGMVTCLLIAVAGRVSIGGTGMTAGVVTILLAGGVGMAWTTITAGPERRNWLALMCLGLAAPISFLGALMLPYEMTMWFVTQATLPLALVYAITIPLVGNMLERERVRMDTEARLRAAARAEPESGFPDREDLQDEMARSLAAGIFDRGAAVLQVAFRPGLGHSGFWGEDVEDLVAVSLYQRIAPLLPDGVIIGEIRSGQVLILAPGHLALGIDGLAARIRRDVATKHINLPGTVSSQPSISLTRVDYEGLPDLAGLLSGAAAIRPDPGIADRPVADGSGDYRLFEMAERLLAHHRGSGDGQVDGSLTRRDS